jgi:hypothetical protein
MRELILLVALIATSLGKMILDYVCSGGSRFGRRVCLPYADQLS